MLTSQDVVSAYKLVLGREPESSAVIDNYVNHSDFDHLRGMLLGSGEFAERLSRDPRLLGVSMAALTATAEVRRYQSLLESLVALALPVWDRSVLIVGDAPASLAGFFLDRQCKVSVAASSQTADLLQRILTARRLHAANTSIVSYDFSNPIDQETSGHFDLVYGELPDNSSDVMRTWLDNAAEACTGTLIVTSSTAPGQGEDVFVTPSLRTSTQFRTIPTKRWVYSRLRERFEHLYGPSHRPFGSSFLQDGLVGTGETEETYVASRFALNSAALEDYVFSASRPRSSSNGAVVATRV